MKILEKKPALVTGAGKGIGRAIALQSASEGASIAVVDVNEEKMQAVTEEIQAVGSRATVFKADVISRENVLPPLTTPKKNWAVSTSS